MKKIISFISVLIFAFLFVFTPIKTFAQDLKELLPVLVKEHERIKAAEERVNAAEYFLNETKGARYPHLDLLTDWGREKVAKPNDPDKTYMTRNYQLLRATQLLTDFGQTCSTIGRAKYLLEKTSADLEVAKQQITLNGIVSYLNVTKAREKLFYARESEGNITRQTGMEEELVKRGAGLSSDVLQTKAQLSGAKALRVSVEGELAIAKNSFKSLFKKYPTTEEVKDFKTPDALPKIPETLEQAIAEAKKNNPQIKAAQYNINVAGEELKFRKAKYFPKLNLFAEATRREDDGGVEGTRDELLGGVELNFNFLNGGSDVAGMKVASANLIAAENVLKDIEEQTEEMVRNAWQQLITAQENYKFLKNQANIASEFLNLARKERTLGTRSLLDVLNGEVNYINSISKSVAAHIDTYIAVFNLHFAMGTLSVDLI